MKETVITCDRCGGKIKEDVRWINGTTRVLRILKQGKSPGKINATTYKTYIDKINEELPEHIELFYSYYPHFKTYDLCPDCRKAFAEFMRGEGNGNNRG